MTTLQRLRYVAQLSRRQLAESLDLPVVTVVRAERHPDRVPDEQRRKIEDFLVAQEAPHAAPTQ